MQNKKGCGCGAKNKGVVQTPPAQIQADTVPPPGPINQQTPNVGYMKYPIQAGVLHTTPVKVKPEMAENNTPTEQQFQPRQVESAKSITEQIGKKIGMVQSFASALASRGLSNAKINKPTKQLRVLSCFGNKAQGGELPPCEYLKNSTVLPGKHFCGGCGCGDKPHTWLVADGEQYSKLDYPRLSCPLKMPGFTNYEASKPEEAGPPPTRRNYIENINYSEIEKIPVTLPEMEKPPPSHSEQK
jgi:hypothetical protein